MTKKEAIIFDLDGTLLDTLEDLYQSVIYVQNKFAYPLHDKQQVRSHVGNGMRVLMEKSLPEDATKEEVEKAFLLCQAYYGEHSLDATKPYEGIMDMLAALDQKGYKMAIVSNKPDFAVKELNKIFFQKYIPIAIGEKESQGIRKKPAPDTVMAALEALHARPDQAIYVGDSEVDILTAQNSGMDHILCEWGFRDKTELLRYGAENFVQCPEDIIKLL